MRSRVRDTGGGKGARDRVGDVLLLLNLGGDLLSNLLLLRGAIEQGRTVL